MLLSLMQRDPTYYEQIIFYGQMHKTLPVLRLPWKRMVLEDAKNIFTPGMLKNALRAFIMSFPSSRMQGYKFTKCYQYSHWMIKTCKSLS